jgi:SpoVK/Ycf46/Vps4 family AAA+-type ATPase
MKRVLLIRQLSEDCQVFIIGATRRKDEVSAALLSATRFGVEQEISIPNSQQRSQVFS